MCCVRACERACVRVSSCVCVCAFVQLSSLCACVKEEGGC